MLLARALPGAREDALSGAVRGGQARVDGRVERSPDRAVPPGARVGAELQVEEGLAPAARLRLRGEDFAVLETSPGWLPPGSDAAAVLRQALPALPSQELEIVIAGDSDAPALWLVAFGKSPRRGCATRCRRRTRSKRVRSCRRRHGGAAPWQPIRERSVSR